MTLGLLLTAVGLGLRHGVDWDHIAAIADLTSTADTRRRGLVLSFLYAVGHAVVVIVLGVAAIAFGATLPAGVEDWMGRVVGVTLVALGLWIAIDLIRKGRDFRLRSRWIVILDGTLAGLRRVRSDRRVASSTPAPAPAPTRTPAPTPTPGRSRSPVPTAATVGARPHPHSDVHSHSHSHSHVQGHRHQLSLARSRPSGPGNGAAAGIGLLHGIGVESPTQIALFVASTSVVGVGPGLALLLAWVGGLLAANSALAALAAFGLLEADRNFAIYAGVAVLVAAASTVMGALLVVGLDVLPSP